MQHLKGVQGTKPLDTNPISAANKANKEEGQQPADEQLRISYGTIAEVDQEGNRVRIDLIERGNVPKRLGSSSSNKDGIWVSLIQPIHVIHTLYGALRRGLIVRVSWKGKHEPKSESVVEVISDLEINEFLSGSQEPRSNELATGPYKMFLGGSGGVPT